MSLFVEVEPTRVSLFVRDRGKGFDPAEVAADRAGHRRVHPGPHGPPRGDGRHPQRVGQGTEVELVMPQDRGTGSAVRTPVRPSSNEPKVRVFLVDDHHLFLSGVRAELGDAVEVVGDADEVDAAIELIAERLPDVVLVDVHMPDGGGQAVIEADRAHPPEVRFLALSVSDAAEDVIGVIRAGRAGTSPRPSRAPSSPTPCERVADGDAVFSPAWPASSSTPSPLIPMPPAAPVPSFDPELDQLTPREREVLRLIARGYAYKEVARELSASRSRPWRPTCPPSCASCSSPAATSSRAGRPSAACSDAPCRAQGSRRTMSVAADQQGADGVGAQQTRSRARTGRRGGSRRALLPTSWLVMAPPMVAGR